MEPQNQMRSNSRKRKYRISEQSSIVERSHDTISYEW